MGTTEELVGIPDIGSLALERPRPASVNLGKGAASAYAQTACAPDISRWHPVWIFMKYVNWRQQILENSCP
jgi:hypothetical protein